MKYVLKKAIQLGEETISELNLREEIVAGDLRGLPAREFHHDDVIKIIGRLSGQTDVVVNKLSFADYNELSGIVMGFMLGGQETGKN